MDVSAILKDKTLREALFDFYRSGFEYSLVDEVYLWGRLGIKAAWDEEFKEGGFDQCFFILDSITSDLEFPRKVDFGEVGNYSETKKRRRI